LRNVKNLLSVSALKSVAFRDDPNGTRTIFVGFSGKTKDFLIGEVDAGIQDGPAAVSF
jgi:hypothetical protein